MFLSLLNEHQLKPLKAIFAFLEKEFPGKEYICIELNSFQASTGIADCKAFFHDADGLPDGYWEIEVHNFANFHLFTEYAGVKLAVHMNAQGEIGNVELVPVVQP